MNTTENNKLIAEFLGRDYSFKLPYMTTEIYPLLATECLGIDSLKFHSDWNWLIPAIWQLNDKLKDTSFKRTLMSNIASCVLVDDINGANQYLIDGIEWYNQQQK